MFENIILAQSDYGDNFLEDIIFRRDKKALAGLQSGALKLYVANSEGFIAAVSSAEDLALVKNGKALAWYALPPVLSIRDIKDYFAAESDCRASFTGVWLGDSSRGVVQCGHLLSLILNN